MNALSPTLRAAEGDHILFWCPGCDEAHMIRARAGHGQQGGYWGWDGNAEAPTFYPSIKVTHEHWVPPAPTDQPQTKVIDICHSFVRAGQIQFLSDCTHPLAGQTVPLPPFPWSECDER